MEKKKNGDVTYTGRDRLRTRLALRFSHLICTISEQFGSSSSINECVEYFMNEYFNLIYFVFFRVRAKCKQCLFLSIKHQMHKTVIITGTTLV